MIFLIYTSAQEQVTLNYSGRVKGRGTQVSLARGPGDPVGRRRVRTTLGVVYTPSDGNRHLTWVRHCVCLLTHTAGTCAAGALTQSTH